MLPCVIDIEASGFGPGSYPIEVGYVLPDGGARCTLVQPATGWTHWDERAQRLHGIDRDLLRRHGRPVAVVARMLNDDLAGRLAYTDNWAHDYPWLARLFDAAGVAPAFRLAHLRQLLDESQAARWDRAFAAAQRRLRVDRHRASNDARVVQRALRHLGVAAPVMAGRAP
ncbi:hypothetical protein [Ideonella sp.]|uniref:3'-5' exonuclease n=1 Tax=Ideonella sp. TaxID=1929293 RepID=UPI0035AD8695